MEKMLASMYIYIYQNLFASTKTYEKLTTYSDAIMTTLEEGGVLHNFYLTLRILAFGIQLNNKKIQTKNLLLNLNLLVLQQLCLKKLALKLIQS